MASGIDPAAVEGSLDFHGALERSGLSAARFRFLEKEFGESIGLSTHFFLPARYSQRQIGLLRKFDGLLRSSGRTAAEVRDTLRSYLDVRRRGIWVAAVTSGKGGVGKTSMAVNLAVSLSRLGLRPTVVDADLGTANAHLLLGLTPARTLRDLVQGRAGIEEILSKTAYGVRLVPGGSGSRVLADIDGRGRELLAGEIGKLGYLTDSIVIDTGSGISENVLRFVSLADDIVVVVTPNVASCIDALGLVRAAAERGCTGRVAVVVNRCRSDREAAAVYGRFSQAARQLTGSVPSFLGFAPEDHRMEEAYLRGMPVTSHSPACAVSRGVRQIARAALAGRREPREKPGESVLKIFEGLAAAG